MDLKRIKINIILFVSISTLLALPTLSVSAAGSGITSVNGSTNNPISFDASKSVSVNWDYYSSSYEAELKLDNRVVANCYTSSCITNLGTLTVGTHHLTTFYVRVFGTDKVETQYGPTWTVIIISAPPSISEALDISGYSFTTGGSNTWSGETNVYHYDFDAIQSGDIVDSQSTYVQTVITGPKVVSFFWSVSSEANYDFLSFWIDSAKKNQISGSVGWQQMVYSIPSGTHTIKWIYAKDSSVSRGSDCGYVDKLQILSFGTLSSPSSSTQSEYQFNSYNINWNTNGWDASGILKTRLLKQVGTGSYSVIKTFSITTSSQNENCNDFTSTVNNVNYKTDVIFTKESGSSVLLVQSNSITIQILSSSISVQGNTYSSGGSTGTGKGDASVGKLGSDAQINVHSYANMIDSFSWYTSSIGYTITPKSTANYKFETNYLFFGVIDPHGQTARLNIFNLVFSTSDTVLNTNTEY